MSHGENVILLSSDLIVLNENVIYNHEWFSEFYDYIEHFLILKEEINPSGDIPPGGIDIGDYDKDDFEGKVEGSVSGIISDMSGDLNNSEIFGALEQMEKGFFEALTEKPRRLYYKME